ncbi:MAG: hypothetical protein FWE76_01565 [Symbiobacteriaceae bacterium]|nr:hypothetical protein [Symbiobacteriaceae bacterium]
MSNVKLFWLREDSRELRFDELRGEERPLDTELRQLLEDNLHNILGIRVLASNYPLHSNQDERIPTLGLDENDRPTIIHYGSGALALNQGLFYLNWLLDHRADFNLQVLLQMGADGDKTVQWHMPRLICIGDRVASYALHTAAQAAVTVDILRYRFHSANLLLIERMLPPLRNEDLPAEILLRLNNLLQPGETNLQRLYLTLQQTIFSLSNDIELIIRDRLIVFRRLRNIAAVQIMGRHLALYINLNLSQISMNELSLDFVNDVNGRVPNGIGRIEALISDQEQLSAILPLLQRSLENG